MTHLESNPTKSAAKPVNEILDGGDGLAPPAQFRLPVLPTSDPQGPPAGLLAKLVLLAKQVASMKPTRVEQPDAIVHRRPDRSFD